MVSNGFEESASGMRQLAGTSLDLREGEAPAEPYAQ